MEAGATTIICDSGSLAKTVGFAVLGSELGEAVECALQDGLAGGAVFPQGSDPLSIFRHTLADSIRDIESHPRGKLFQEFLLKGPYEDAGEIPPELAGERDPPRLSYGVGPFDPDRAGILKER